MDAQKPPRRNSVTSLATEQGDSQILALSGKGVSLNNFLTTIRNEQLGFHNLENYLTWLLVFDGLACSWDPERTITRKGDLSNVQRITERMVLALTGSLLQGWTEEMDGYFQDAVGAIDQTDPGAPKEPMIHDRPIYRLVCYSSKRVCESISMYLQGTLPYQTLKEIGEVLLSTQSRIFPPEGKPLPLAILAGLKGDFAAHLGRTRDSIIYFKIASKLNPKYFEWAHGHYAQLRKGRLEERVHKCPTEEEADACSTAFSLCPETWRALEDMADLLSDKNRERGKEGLPGLDFESNKKSILTYLNMARKGAPNNIRLALKYVHVSMMYSQKSRKQECEDELLLILDACQRKEPTNSKVFNTYGKYYMSLKDSANALKHFEKSLEMDPSNFSALMNFLSIKLNTVELNDGIELVHSYMDNYLHKPLSYIKLHILLGYLRYSNNELTEAISAWMYVFFYEEMNAGDKSRLEEHLRNVMKGGHGTPGVQIHLILQQLEEIVTTHEVADDCRDTLHIFKIFLIKMLPPPPRPLIQGMWGNPGSTEVSINFSIPRY